MNGTLRQTSGHSEFAIFGGSFDPVHLGHLAMAREVLESCGYDRIVFVPTGKSPLKEAAMAGGADRIAMLSLAIADTPEFEIDDWEVGRPGPSFTVDTVRHFAKDRAGSRKPGLILGSDVVSDFDLWKEPDAIEEMVDLIVLQRPGAPVLGFGRKHREVPNTPVDISSREIRNFVRKGKPYRHLVPVGVADYIEQHGLYR